MDDKPHSESFSECETWNDIIDVWLLNCSWDEVRHTVAVLVDNGYEEMMEEEIGS